MIQHSYSITNEFAFLTNQAPNEDHESKKPANKRTIYTKRRIDLPIISIILYIYMSFLFLRIAILTTLLNIINSECFQSDPNQFNVHHYMNHIP